MSLTKGPVRKSWLPWRRIQGFLEGKKINPQILFSETWRWESELCKLPYQFPLSLRLQERARNFWGKIIMGKFCPWNHIAHVGPQASCEDLCWQGLKVPPDSATVVRLWRIRADQGNVNEKEKPHWLPMKGTTVTLNTALKQQEHPWDDG